MALNPTANIWYRRGVRDYPNYHGLLGIRGFWDVGSQAPGWALKVDTPVIIGKMPALSFITYATVGVSVAVAGPATPILDVGLRDAFTGVVTRAALVAAADLTTPGIVIGAGAGRGLVTTDQEVVVTLGTTGGPPTAGRFNVVVCFVPKLT